MIKKLILKKEVKMKDKCVYCDSELTDSRATSICNNCGVKVWGEKMFETIVKNMEGAREAGDLYQGSVTDPVPEKKKVIPFSSQSEQEKFKILHFCGA